MGRPRSGLVCPPLASWGSGLLNTGWLAKRAQELWDRAELRRITLQEARHTAGTWLDAAGVSPKVASVLMGHAVPGRQPGAATITLARYTHALPGDIERARDRLAKYCARARAQQRWTSAVDRPSPPTQVGQVRAAVDHLVPFSPARRRRPHRQPSQQPTERVAVRRQGADLVRSSDRAPLKVSAPFARSDSSATSNLQTLEHGLLELPEDRGSGGVVGPAHWTARAGSPVDSGWLRLRSASAIAPISCRVCRRAVTLPRPIRAARPAECRASLSWLYPSGEVVAGREAHNLLPPPCVRREPALTRHGLVSAVGGLSPGHAAVSPPSITSCAPVTKAAASEAR